MSSQVCVNCHNKKTVNLTDNRLVTESCGHVKCVDCLVMEKSGCLACFGETGDQELEDNSGSEVEVNMANGSAENDLPVDSDEPNMNGQDEHEDLTDRHPLAPHIKIETDEKGSKLFTCICGKQFSSRHESRQVKYHAYCNGQRKPFQCPDCSKSFAVQSHYLYHMRVHRGERMYACETCGDTFYQMSKLQRHKLKHTKEKKFVCNECDKGFDNLTALRKHGVTHTVERPFRCGTCGLRYRDPSNLRKHVVKHATRSMCSICGRGGAESAEGAEGATNGTSPGARCMHQERRAYQCPRCPQAFHSNKDMRRHAQVHTDSKPYRCKVCNRRFRRKDNLERHIRNTHPDFVPASAVECDENALKQITTTNGHTSPPTDEEVPEKIYECNEKTKLEILNPLPPLPEEVMQKHIHTETHMENMKDEKPIIDKSYILEANNSRQSVIVAKCAERKISSPVTEYVHKIRKANSISCGKDNSLPPINEAKFKELDEKTNLNNLDIGVPNPKQIPIFKKILYPQINSDKEMNGRIEKDAEVQNSVDSNIHWRRKLLEEMKLNIN